MQPRRVAHFDSSTPEYTRSFHTFLAHTDQKTQALEWLEQEVSTLSRRETAIDAGAGTGKLTTWLAERFATVVAVERNPSLAADLRSACPPATLIPETILAADPKARADFALCSHVLYYVPRAEWEAHVRHLIGWLAPGGVLAIALQNPDTDCMHMVDHFIGGRFGLNELVTVADGAPGGPYDVRLDTVEAHIRTDDLPTACAVAEFILNTHPMSQTPTWADLEAYVADRFVHPEGGYRYSCHQDFLRISRPT